MTEKRFCLGTRCKFAKSSPHLKFRFFWIFYVVSYLRIFVLNFSFSLVYLTFPFVLSSCWSCYWNLNLVCRFLRNRNSNCFFRGFRMEHCNIFVFSFFNNFNYIWSGSINNACLFKLQILIQEFSLFAHPFCIFLFLIVWNSWWELRCLALRTMRRHFIFSYKELIRLKL